MKILYVCEFCGNRSERRSVIEDCEKQGRPVGDELPPVGLIYGSYDGNNPNAMYAGFAWLVDCARQEGHSFDVSGAVFRANMPVDDEPNFNVGSRYGNWIGRGNKGWREWPDAPPPGPVLDRAIAACRKAGVTPLILRGGEALPV